MTHQEELSELMEEAIGNDSITCRECEEVLEVGCKACECGWVNPLVEEGLISAD